MPLPSVRTLPLAHSGTLTSVLLLNSGLFPPEAGGHRDDRLLS